MQLLAKLCLAHPHESAHSSRESRASKVAQQGMPMLRVSGMRAARVVGGEQAKDLAKLCEVAVHK